MSFFLRGIKRFRVHLTLIFNIIMRIRSFLFVIDCVVSTVSNSQTATSPTIGCVPLNVNFEAPAGATTYFWDFGDGATSNLKSPVNPYTIAGTYTVIFRATAGGPPVGSPITVTVSPKPVPTITTSSILKGCVPLTVNLAGNAVLPAGVTLGGYKWSFGDGTGATGSPTTKTYVTPGKFTVALEVTTSSSSCNVTKQFVDYVSCSAPPTTAFTTTPSPATACVPPLTVSFTNTTTSTLPLTYLWTMHNGTTTTVKDPPAVTITTAGSYIVSLTATDSNKCTSTYSVPVNVGSPAATFTVKDTVCINTPVTFTNTSSPGTYAWNFGTGATPATSGVTNPVVTYSTAGIKTITLNVTTGACSGTVTKNIYVDDPKITFTYTPSYSCYEPVSVKFNSTGTSKIVSWNWSFGDKKNGTSTLEDPTYTYVIDDSIYTKRGMHVFKVTLNAVTAAGCAVTATNNDTVFLTWARFVPNKYKGCAPLTVTFNDSSRSNTPKEPIVTWIWNYGDGTIDTLTNKGPHDHIFTNPGEYDVQLTITNKNGCKDTSYKVKIQVGSIKPIDFVVNKVDICPGDTVAFTNTTIDKTGFDGWNYSSNGELLSHCSSIDNPALVFNDKTGPQTITLTGDYNGCMSTMTKTALINVKGPIARFDFHRTCEKKFDADFINKSGDATTISWDFGDGTKLDTVGTLVNWTHSYAKTGDYTVILTAKNPACADSKDTAIIHIRDIQANYTSSKLLCSGAEYKFDATASIDVYPHCYRGYTWAFSDTDKRPISTSDPNTPIVFTKTGNQTVSLIVEDINGCKDTVTTGIKVYSIQPNFTMSTAKICLPSIVNFDPASSTADTTIVPWDWVFGDGKTATLPGPGPGNTSNLYTSAPTSPIFPFLIVTDKLGCKDTVRKNIDIYTPTSKITITPKTDICKGTEITVFGDDYTAQGSNLKFDWTMGDGIGVFNNQNNFKYTYQSSGSFVVSLKYTEISSGCNGNLTKTVNVQDYPLSSFTSNPSNQTVLCYPQVVDFTSTASSTSPIVTYKWDLGNGLSPTTPTASNSYPKGKFVVKLSVSTSFGCTDDTTMLYNVVGPEANYTLAPTTPVCRGEAVTFTIKDTVDVDSYTWKFGDGTSATDVSPAKHAYSYVPPSGKTAAALILYDKNKVCSVSIPIDVYIQSVKADFTIANMSNVLDTTICLGQNAVFDNSGSKNGSSFNWDFGDNTSSTVTPIVNHAYTTPGLYTVTLITKSASLGCSDTATKKVTILPLPVITAVGDSICPNKNQDAQLAVVPNTLGYTYSWIPVTGLSSATVNNPVVIKPTTNITYTVLVTDQNSCTSVDSAKVYVVPPVVSISFDTTIVVGDVVHLPIDNKGGTINFTWTPATGLSCLKCSYPVVQPLKDITYNVFMQDVFGCSDGTGVFKIRIKPETFIKVPTTFTPNGDGTNDIIYVKGWGIKDLISFQIYNRWGEMVFSSSELNEGWNGFYKDVLQNNDIYTYKVTAVDFFDEPMEATGHINLMR